jgi:diguanylate cyclase (GGDEF)-like protein/PAS domain S-box-containing protein
LGKQHDALAQAYAALAAREAELADAQRIATIAKIGSWSWDILSDRTWASQEMCRIFGLQEIPQFAQQPGLMFPRDAWLALREARLTMARTGQGYNLDLPALHADGSQLWVNSRAEVVRDSEGNITGLRGMVQDITERKQAESIAKNERFIRTITDAIPALVAYWDSELRCKFFNQAYLNWWGKPAETMQGITMQALLGESLFAIYEPAIREVLSGESKHFERFLTKHDGTVGHVLADYIPDRDAHGSVVGFIVIVTDIKALKVAETELQLAAAVIQNIAEGILVTDLAGVIQSVNPAFTKITGFPAEEAIGHTPRILRSDRHDAPFHAALWNQIANQGHWQGEIWNRRKNGEVFLERQTITRIAGGHNEVSRYVSVFHDITDAWQANEDNRHLAFHDPLTKLPNRTLLLERLERQIARAKREPGSFAVMFLDLDHFKAVNDTLGHAVGDELLIVVAQKLQTLVRQTDTVARIGGDEFVIKLDNPASQDEVNYIAQRVIGVINETIEIKGHQIQVGASVGIALYPENGTTANELIQNADAAMYAAKRTGRNKFRLYSAEMVQGLNS